MLSRCAAVPAACGGALGRPFTYPLTDHHDPALCSPPPPGRAYVPWDVTYILVNMGMIRRTLKERAQASKEEQSMLTLPAHREAYDGQGAPLSSTAHGGRRHGGYLAAALTKREAHVLLAAAVERTLQPGQALLVRTAPGPGPAAGMAGGSAVALAETGSAAGESAHGSPQLVDADQCVCLVLEGSLAVNVGGAAVGCVGAGDWVGHVPLLLERRSDASSLPSASASSFPAAPSAPPAPVAASAAALPTGSASENGALGNSAAANGGAPADPPGSAALLLGGEVTTTLTAREPTRVLQWPRAALAACLAAEPQIERGVHVIWNLDLAKRLARPRALDGYEQARSTLVARAEYADILRALVSRGHLNAAQLDHLSHVRAELGIDEAEHALATALLARSGSVSPELIHALLTSSTAAGSTVAAARR